MTGKVSFVRRNSPSDVQSKVMEQKPSLLECFCGSCKVCLAKLLSTLAVMDDEPRSSFWTEILRKTNPK